MIWKRFLVKAYFFLATIVQVLSVPFSQTFCIGSSIRTIDCSRHVLLNTVVT